jgi:hypothetical protein
MDDGSSTHLAVCARVHVCCCQGSVHDRELLDPFLLFQASHVGALAIAAFCGPI